MYIAWDLMSVVTAKNKILRDFLCHTFIWIMESPIQRSTGQVITKKKW